MKNQTLNNSEVHVMESTRKRKRESEKCTTLQSAIPDETKQPATAGFVNTAFSSTPKKLIVKRRMSTTATTIPTTYPPPCLEVKSIAHIVQQSQCTTKQPEIQQELPKNPFEVVRKPPKKKKRQADMQEACFENPALNLELPEKQFNPYEVVRAPISMPVRDNCFVNQALNLRGQDIPAARNPFEITRCNNIVPDAATGVDNSALETITLPTELKIRLPFTPTVGCRIDFQNLPLKELTPSKLLAEKLVFSPVPRAKRSIDSVGDENSTMDIGKELDRYQLELENSINEAKLRKNCVATEMDANYKVEIMEQKITFTQKLQEIVEDDEDEEEKEDMLERDKANAEQLQNIAIEFKCSDNDTKDATLSAIKEDKIEEFIYENDKAATEDIAYASESEEETDSDFKRPSTFIRNYRRDAITANSKESLNSTHSSKSTGENEYKKPHNVKNLIRKSLRKLMHSSNVPKTEDAEQTEKEPVKHTNMLRSIRNSLRRKPVRQPLIAEEDEQPKVVDISIIDRSERTVKLKSCSHELQYATIEQLTNEKKHSLRNSIRRSKQIIKSILHKDQEHYAFCK